MHILVLNGGSSSIKFSIYNATVSDNAADPSLVLDGEIDRIGTPEAALRVTRPEFEKSGSSEEKTKTSTIEEAVGAIFRVLSNNNELDVQAVGYRVVHPGATLREHQRITEFVLHAIEEATAFAPLHNPEAVAIIRAGMQRFPNIDHYACFDTVFHQTMPEEASTYPLPSKWRDLGVRRYGFHGLSCEWIVRKMRDEHGNVPKRMIVAHLGSGCSVTAIVDGVSIDTSMGFTPTGGVVMGTRPGDLDPAILLYLARQQQEAKHDALSSIESDLNHKSGLVALSGQPNDMRAIRKAAAAGDEGAKLAIKIFVRSITKAIGSYSWLMGGIDAIVFTGGIGEHDELTREEALINAGSLGVTLDLVLNSAKVEGRRRISTEASKTAVSVVKVEEDCMIAIHVAYMVSVHA